MIKEKCPCCEKIGGPGWVESECPKCGKKEMVYRLGSWDWETKICMECRMKEHESRIVTRTK